ncbi:tumor necrosis factor receptor superfamily member 1A [Stigmatopora argus]
MHGEMVAFGVLLTMACLAMSTLALSPTVTQKTCPSSDYLVDEICCNKCHAGFKLVKHCISENSRTTCVECPDGQFLDHMNYSPNCWKCRTCKKNRHEVEISKCEHYRDTLCRCNDTYYSVKIDSETTDCVKCSTCSADELEIQKCTPERNTVCKCKENYIRVKEKCQPCKNCTDECKHLCKSLASHKPGADSESQSGFLVNVLIASVVVAVVLLMAVICYLATKRLAKTMLRKPLIKTAESLDSEKSLFQKEMSQSVTQCTESVQLVQEQSNLPDCVPPEIKTYNVIYTVLDLVHVQQLKQLVRSLGVTDTVIQWAEQENKTSKEAHYQMLKAWAEGGSHVGSGNGILHPSMLQELLLKLKQMHLKGVAEELETKYCIH